VANTAISKQYFFITFMFHTRITRDFQRAKIQKINEDTASEPNKLTLSPALGNDFGDKST
jgi:hypothetical protein